MVRAMMIMFFVVGLVACDKGKKDKPADKPAPTAPAVAADGTRRVDVEAGQDGYKPDKIPGKPGEKLTLVFKRTVDAQCLSQVKTPDGKLVDLPLNQPVEVAVTVPTSGDVGFACGMGMFHGVVVAQP